MEGNESHENISCGRIVKFGYFHFIIFSIVVPVMFIHQANVFLCNKEL